MPGVTYAEQYFECRPGETVLQTLLRNRVHVPYYCQIGSCKTCVMRIVAGSPPAGSQDTLHAAEIERGCFMVCVSVVDCDIVVERADV